MTGRMPSVDSLARSLADTGLPHPVLVDIARATLAEARSEGSESPAPSAPVEGPDVQNRARQAADEASRRLLQPVINATGVLLHTNLGRAPVSVSTPAQYSNVEFDLVEGHRGDRAAHAAKLLATACGAEAAIVVNNGAAAVLLALTALAAGQEVVVSRGELVEIGGGFRIPEVLAASGARLREVGTTNRTRLDDYRKAVGDDTAAVLKVHASNFRITGFTESTPVRALTTLERPVVVDLGSGLLDRNCPWLTGGPPPWLGDEPAAVQTLRDGAAVVTFSGDKLLGGPQAGVIAGRAELVERCRRHPMARALRPGSLVLDALQTVALAYLRRDVATTVPLWKMATARLDDLEARAGALGVGEVVECLSVMGGGTLPGTVIPSFGVAVPGDVTAALRRSSPPVVARVAEGHTICDLRTVFEEQDVVLSKALSSSE
jgi:L-seryl-tRNA(Ser) seleniumtransferase